MKKRIAALSLAVLTLVLALGFAGCKKNDKTDWDYIADKGELVIGITYFRPIIDCAIEEIHILCAGIVSFWFL